MASIFLIRHGQASFGTDNYDRLSELGCQQAKVLGEYLSSSGIHFDAVYSGSLQRQKETAEISMQAQPSPTPIHTDARFNEINIDEQFEHLMPAVIKRYPEISELIERAKKHSKSYQKVMERVFGYWVSDECNDPNIQSWADYSTLVNNAIQDLIKKEGSGKTVAVFTSGGTIATIVSQALDLDGSFAYRFYEPVINASITRLLYNKHKISLSSYNDYSYLTSQSKINNQSLVTYR